MVQICLISGYANRFIQILKENTFDLIFNRISVLIFGFGLFRYFRYMVGYPSKAKVQQKYNVNEAVETYVAETRPMHDKNTHI